jgi:membrane peptidoglycan carboxypeptidase
MKRFFKRFAAFVLVLTVMAAVAGRLAYTAWVVDDPGPGFQRAEILAVIAQESPVTYRDGKTPLGVFFDSEHRSYVSYTDLPQDWVHAIVAAEDGNFFKHPGFDPKHILRAAWQNIVAGHVVAGGSTLSQQTAKNLFYRPDRSWKAKLAEATTTLRLEAHFSKEDILEFYANQFHVSANGRGIGIAARYFFDKTPKELTTKECAFIAGLVKAPSRYNPFVGESEARREAARAAAEERTHYVLRRMFEEGYLDERTLSQLEKEPLAFRHGAFQYDRSVVLDEVQRELDSQTFVDLFARLGIDNPSTAGIRITTTLDANTQREAVYGLWHHLTELGPKLERKTPADLQLPDRTQMSIEPGVPLARHGFYSARVTAVGAESVTLDVGSRPCTVDKEGLERIAAVLGAKAADIPPALPVGTFVLTSVRKLAGTELGGGRTAPPEPPGRSGLASSPSTAADTAAEATQCDLEMRPELQGAVVVLDEGNVRAMVGGNDNRNFNRAMSAQRQFGSTWKPILYMAAMQLGWTATDTLDNRRNVFPFRDVWYYPHADHVSDPYLPLTLVGARSENLASIWLLHHLMDRLNPEQFRQVAEAVGFGDADGIQRAREVEAIRSSPDRFPEYAFQIAREDVLSGLAFGAHPEDALALRSLQYGRGFAAERARVLATASSPEKTARLGALGANLLSLEELVSRCGTADQLYQDPVVGTLVCGAPPAGFEAVTGTGGADLPALTGDVLVDGRIHLSTLQEVRRVLDTRVAELAGKDPWSMDALALNPDFRILVGIRYVAKLAEAFGVKSALPTVMSLPLGAADITLLDAASMYQGMLKGEHYSFPGEGFEDSAVPGLRSNFAVPAMDIGLIAEIRDSSGNVLYRATGKAEPVADPVSGELTGDILRNVVTMGTGRRAYGVVKVGADPVVTVGKTGTTNEYKNVAFVGMVPKSGSAGRWGEAYTIAAYVGYDDNHPMKRGSFKVQGASGALPVWIATARGMAEAGLLDAVAEYVPSAGLTRVPVPPATGMSAAPAALVPENGQRRFALLTQPATLTAAPVEVAPTAEPVVPNTEPVELPQDLAPVEPSVWDGL